MTELEPGTHPVPASLKAQEAWRRSWAGLVMLVPSVAATAYVVAVNGLSGEGTWAMLALCGAVTLVIAWSVIHTVMMGQVRYEVDGIRFMFGDPDYFVPAELMSQFVREHVWSPFRGLTGDRHPHELTEGVLVILETEPHARVREEDGQIRVKTVLGATQPWRHYSRVAASRALDPGVCGYELKLHCCHALFPGRSEAEDIEWMKNNGVI